MARSSLQTRRRADNLHEILEAARELVTDQGPGALTLGAVATRVGITTPALYHYFDNKKALLQALVLAGVEAEADMLVATAQGWSGDPAEILAGIVRAMYAHYRPKLSTFRMIYLQLQLGPQGGMGMDATLKERVHPHSRRLFDALQAVLDAGQAAGVVQPGLETRTAVVAAHAAAIGVLTMIALAERADDPLRQGDEQLVGALCHLLVSGARVR